MDATYDLMCDVHLFGIGQEWPCDDFDGKCCVYVWAEEVDWSFSFGNDCGVGLIVGVVVAIIIVVAVIIIGRIGFAIVVITDVAIVGRGGRICVRGGSTCICS